jgi:NADH-quinone oxidoreductase subunit G
VLYKQVREESRLTAVKSSGQPASLDAAITAAAEILKGGSVAVVGSGRSSVEEQFLTKKLADTFKATTALVGRVGEGDKLLISSDRNPNVRGALVTGLINKLPETKLADLGAAIDSGKVTTILSINEDLTAAGLTAAQLAKVKIVFVGTHASATSEAAAVILPTVTVFEKSGSFINQQFRLQKFNQAIPALAGTTNDLVVLSKLVAAVGGDAISSDLATLWKSLAEEVRILAGVSFATLAENGLVLNATDFANLAFPEGETLHFKPAAKPAVATA